jgi:hypothetical protein
MADISTEIKELEEWIKKHPNFTKKPLTIILRALEKLNDPKTKHDPIHKAKAK